MMIVFIYGVSFCYLNQHKTSLYRIPSETSTSVFNIYLVLEIMSLVSKLQELY